MGRPMGKAMGRAAAVGGAPKGGVSMTGGWLTVLTVVKRETCYAVRYAS